MKQQDKMRKINGVVMVCAMACLACYDIFGGLWLKGVTSSWFVLLGGINLWAARKQEGAQRRFFVFVFLGLLCGMCADVLLGITFVVGVAAFALGHILYLIAFYSLERFCIRDLWIMVPAAVFFQFALVGTPWIRVEDDLLKYLLMGYAVVISIMLGKAVSNLISKPCPYRWLLAVGSLLFCFSDLILAIDMFGESSRLTWILCSYSYWPAQSLLAHSLYHARKAMEEA